MGELTDAVPNARAGTGGQCRKEIGPLDASLGARLLQAGKRGLDILVGNRHLVFQRIEPLVIENRPPRAAIPRSQRAARSSNLRLSWYAGGAGSVVGRRVMRREGAGAARSAPHRLAMRKPTPHYDFFWLLLVRWRRHPYGAAITQRIRWVHNDLVVRRHASQQLHRRAEVAALDHAMQLRLVVRSTVAICSPAARKISAVAGTRKVFALPGNLKCTSA